MADINVTEEIIDINVTEEVITIEAPSGAYPFPNAVYSVFGRVGAIVAAEGDYSLTQLSDVTLTSPANGQVLKYNGTSWVNSTDADTGITTLNTLTALSQSFATGTSGTDFNISSATSTHTFNLPVASATNTGKLSNTDWANFNAAYNDKINSAAVTGTTTKTLTLNQQDGGTITASWTDDNTDAVTSVFGRTGAVVAASGDYTTTQVTEGTNLYFTNARAQNAITLTTTGTSGAATYSGGTLNIPQYQGVLTNPVTGTGTTNTLPKFTAASTIGNSNITDTGSLITLGSNSFVNGLFGVGSTPVGSSSNFYVSNNITGGTAWNSVYLLTNVLSDVTSQARGFVSNIGTQAATFTLSNLTHYRSEQGTFRAGSTVTTQVGYLASGSLIGATNNYGFQGQIPSGTNRWNLYMDGTAANYLAGKLLVGSTTDAGEQFQITGTSRFIGNITISGSSSTANADIRQIGFVNTANSANVKAAIVAVNGADSDDTSLSFRTSSNSSNISERLRIAGNGATSIFGQLTANSFVPTSSTIPTNGMYLSGTNTLGFATNGTLDMVLDATGNLGLGLTPASNWGRVGFEIGVAGASITREVRDLVLLSNSIWTSTGLVYAATAGAGRFDVGVSSFRWYTAPSGTAGNAISFTQAMTLDANGALGIGATSLTGYNLRVSKNITGATASRGIASDGVVQSDVVTAYLFATNSQTAAATFSTDIVHYFGSHAGTGAGSTITSNTAFMTGNLTGTSVFGFRALSSLTGSSTTQGFRGDITAATNNWNLYMNGSANNYMAGSLGIGSTSLTGYNLRVAKTITGATNSYGVTSEGFVQSDVTSTANYFLSAASTQATTFTLSSIFHYRAQQGTIGAGSTVTNQWGFAVDSNLIGATNNFGFRGAIPNGTGRWNIYMDGTAANYMAGQTGVGTTTLGSYIFNVGGSVATLVNFNSTNASGFYTTYSTSGTERAYIGLGANTISGLGIADFGIVGSSNVVIASGSGGTETMRIDSSKRIGIGTGASINASAKVQIDSTTQGFLPPRMTTTQKTAIGTPAAGLMVYDTTLNQMSYYNGTTWINF